MTVRNLYFMDNGAVVGFVDVPKAGGGVLLAPVSGSKVVVTDDGTSTLGVRIGDVDVPFGTYVPVAPRGLLATAYLDDDGMLTVVLMDDD